MHKVVDALVSCRRGQATKRVGHSMYEGGGGARLAGDIHLFGPRSRRRR